MAMYLDTFRMRIEEQPAFPPEEYRRRAATAQREMAARGIDLVVLFDPQSICYFTGYTSVNLWDLGAVILPTEGAVRLVLWEFEVPRLEASGAEVQVFTYPSHSDPLQTVLKAITDLDPRVYGLDGWTPHVPPEAWSRLRAALSAATLADVRAVLWSTRLRKSSAELELLRTAARATDAGVAAGVRAVRPGAVDHEIASAVTDAMLEAGSDHFAIQPIVAVGPRAGVPHSESSGRRVRPGEGVFLELGASIHRYTAPVMRTVACGTPHPDLLVLADLCTRSVEAAVQTMRPGCPASAVAAAANQVVVEGGGSILFHGYFGYPVGVSFPPSWLEALDYHVTLDNEAPLEEGMVFHLPISLRRRGERGVGLSYTVAVTSGGAEVLTGTPASLILV
jgi:Xaa-Pro dipeptidase